MATRKCGNIYFRKYFMAVRKFTNIFVLLLILMVCMYVCMVITYSRVWINRVRLPILLVVS